MGFQENTKEIQEKWYLFFLLKFEFLFLKDPNKSAISGQMIFRMIRAFFFSYYRTKGNKSPQKLPNTSSIRSSDSIIRFNKSKIMELGSRIMNFFVVGKRTFLRVKSNRIDEETDPHYLKIKVNHDSFYESPSKFEVLETLQINQQFILNKKRRFIGKNFGKNVLKMKKNDNYFVDFLSYITKKKKVKIKTIQKTEFLSSYTRTRGTTHGNFITNTEQKSCSDYVETTTPSLSIL